jgi:hypothetical protein
LALQTLYEGKHLAAGKTIKYVQYTISWFFGTVLA